MNHEFLNNSMELGASVGSALNSLSGELQEVLDGLGRVFAEEAQYYATRGIVADHDIEVDLVRYRKRGSLYCGRKEQCRH